MNHCFSNEPSRYYISGVSNRYGLTQFYYTFKPKLFLWKTVTHFK
jgi:hypothetical protein